MSLHLRLVAAVSIAIGVLSRWDTYSRFDDTIIRVMLPLKLPELFQGSRQELINPWRMSDEAAKNKQRACCTN